MSYANVILELLYDRAGQCVHAQELPPAATPDGLARALVELRQRGHVIEELPSRGLRLCRPTVLDAHLIERGLAARRLGRHVICFAEAGSTNDVAFDSAGQTQEAVVVTAESQRAGRGRLGRRWESPAGSGLLCSVLLPTGGRMPADALTIAAGLAVAEGIEQTVGLAMELEWPNDVVSGGGKLAGVIVEVRQAGGRRRTVIGFGINVSAAPPPGSAPRRAISLADLAHGPVERIELLRAVLCRLDDWTGRLERGESEGLHAGWTARCTMLNRRVTLEHAGAVHTGRVVDIDPFRGLVLQSDAGPMLHFPAATTAVVAGR